jgi:hypothetical protein
VFKLPFTLAIAIVAIAATIASSRVATAEAIGDLNELTKVAARYGENQKKLKTWRGDVRYSKRILAPDQGEGATRHIEYKYRFAIDIAGEKSRLNVEPIRDVVLKDGKEISNMRMMAEAFLARDGVFYDLHYVPETKSRWAFIRTEPFWRKPGDSSLTFAPLYFFTIRGPKLDDRWSFFVKEANNPKFDGTVEVMRVGDLVALKCTVGESHVPGGFTTTADLSQGGNPVKHEAETRYVNSTNVTTCQWEWQEFDGVFVPRMYERSSVTTGPKPDDDHIKIVWTENVVNKSLDDDEFSLGKFGLRKGDRLRDSRNHKELRIQDESMLSGAPPSP